METQGAAQLLTRALAADEQALRRFVGLLTPVIQSRVARVVLGLRPNSVRREIRAQVEELAQEVFLTLFADGARVLRTWQDERGLSLENFVGLVAQRRALSIVRTGKRDPFKEEPTLDSRLDGPSPEPGPERQAVASEHLQLLLRRLREVLSPLGWRLFDLLMIRELEVSAVQRDTGLSRDAVYAWRSRLRRRAQALLVEIESDGAPYRRINLEDGRK